jgi:ribose transport system substrate-binding protein
MHNIVHRARGLAAIATVALSAAAMTACGSDDEETSAASGSGGGSSDSQLAAVQKIVDEHKQASPTIGPQEPIGKPVPSGKTIDYVQCPAESCIIVGKTLKQATDVLGWKLNVVPYQPTPESMQAAFNQVVRNSPDGVIQLGIPASAIARQLKALDDKDIPVTAATASDVNKVPAAPDELDLNLIDPKTNSASTRILAANTILDAGGQGEIGTVFLTGYDSIELYTDAYEDEIKTKCPDCAVKRLSIDPSSLGKDAAQKVANFLRANPDIKHLFLSLDDIGAGLPAAIKATGGTVPKTYGHSPSSVGLRALASGERTAATPGPTPEVGWQMVDALARTFVGESMKEDVKWQGTILWSKEYGNLPEDVNVPVYVDDYQEQFKKLWGK